MTRRKHRFNVSYVKSSHAPPTTIDVGALRIVDEVQPLQVLTCVTVGQHVDSCIWMLGLENGDRRDNRGHDLLRRHVEPSGSERRSQVRSGCGSSYW